ncbi:MAG: hypothetical protein Q8L35_03915 [Actinomycetota bacterium]|nr:hypothetical protein [Actinomycetota bacterium]
MKKYLIVFAVVALAVAIAGCKQQQAPTGGTQQPIPQTAPQQPVGPPTYVAAGKTPEDHVNEYYNAYKEKRLEDAFNLAPAENKAKQPKADFISARQGMPITAFKVGPTQKQGNDKAQIAVEYDLGQNGTWVSTWEFQKKGDKWEAVRYLANMKSQ